MLDSKEIVLQSLLNYVGKVSYKYGGRNPLEGIDCSQLVVLFCRSLGLIGYKEDYNAQAFFEKYKDKEVQSPSRYCFVFWGNDLNKNHIGIMLNDELFLGVEGGNSSTTNRMKAVSQDAYVKIMPISYRKGSPYFIDPFL